MSEPNIIIGALDSLGLVLANHGHTWTDGERAIYEHAIFTIDKACAEKDKRIAELEDSANAAQMTLEESTEIMGERIAELEANLKHEVVDATTMENGLLREAIEKMRGLLDRGLMHNAKCPSVPECPACAWAELKEGK